TFDNEFIFVLLKDGKRLIIDISSLQSQLFNSSIPAFIPGQYDLTKYPDETFEIRLIRRRLNTVDRSRRAALATLNRREDQRAQIFAHANAQLIGDLDTNLEKVRYIPLSDAVA